MATRPPSGGRRKSAAPTPEQNVFVQNSIRYMQAASLFQRRRDSNVWQPLTKGYVKLQVVQCTTSTANTRAVKYTMNAQEGNKQVLDASLGAAMRVKRTTTFVQVILSSSDSNMIGIRLTTQEQAVQLEDVLAQIAPSRPSPPPPGGAEGRKTSRATASASSADTVSIGSTGSDSTDGGANDGGAPGRKAMKRQAPAPPRSASAHALASSAPASVLAQAMVTADGGRPHTQVPPRPTPYRAPSGAAAAPSNSAPPSRSPSVGSLDSHTGGSSSAQTSPSKKPGKRHAPAPPPSSAGTAMQRKTSSSAMPPPPTIEENQQASSSSSPPRMRKVTSDSAMGGASPRRRAPGRPMAASGGMLKAHSMQSISKLSAADSSAPTSPSLASEAPGSLPDQHGSQLTSDDVAAAGHRDRLRSDPHASRPAMALPAKMQRPRSPPRTPPPPPPPPAPVAGDGDDALVPATASVVPDDAATAQLNSIGEEEERRSKETSPRQQDAPEQQAREETDGGPFCPPLRAKPMSSSSTTSSHGESPVFSHPRQGSFVSMDGVDPFGLPPPPPDEAMSSSAAGGSASSQGDDLVPSASSVRLSAAYQADCSTLLDDLENLGNDLDGGTLGTRPGRSGSYTVTSFSDDDDDDDVIATPAAQILSIKPLDDELAAGKSTITLSEGSVDAAATTSIAPPNANSNPPLLDAAAAAAAATETRTAAKPAKAPPKTTSKPKRSVITASTFEPAPTAAATTVEATKPDAEEAKSETTKTTAEARRHFSNASSSPSQQRSDGRAGARPGSGDSRWRSGSFDGAGAGGASEGKRNESPRLLVKQVSALAVAPSTVAKITPRFAGSREHADSGDDGDARPAERAPKCDDDAPSGDSNADVPHAERKLKANRTSGNRLVLNMLPSKKTAELTGKEHSTTMLFNLPPPPLGASPYAARKQPRPESTYRMSGEFMPPPPRADDVIGLVVADLPSPPRDLGEPRTGDTPSSEAMPPPPPMAAGDITTTAAKPDRLTFAPDGPAPPGTDMEAGASTPSKKPPPATAVKTKRSSASTPQSDGPSSELAAKLQRRIRVEELGSSGPTPAPAATSGAQAARKPVAAKSWRASPTAAPSVQVEATSSSLDEPDPIEHESLDELPSPFPPHQAESVLPRLLESVVPSQAPEKVAAATPNDDPESISPADDDDLPPPMDGVLVETSPTGDSSPEVESPASATTEESVSTQDADVMSADVGSAGATPPTDDEASGSSTTAVPPHTEPAAAVTDAPAPSDRAPSSDDAETASPESSSISETGTLCAADASNEASDRSASHASDSTDALGEASDRSASHASDSTDALGEGSAAGVTHASNATIALGNADSAEQQIPPASNDTTVEAPTATTKPSVRFAESTNDTPTATGSSTTSPWRLAPSKSDDDYFLSPSVPNLDVDVMYVSESVAGLELPDVPDDIMMMGGGGGGHDDDDDGFDDLDIGDDELVQSGFGSEPGAREIATEGESDEGAASTGAPEEAASLDTAHTEPAEADLDHGDEDKASPAPDPVPCVDSPDPVALRNEGKPDPAPAAAVDVASSVGAEAGSGDATGAQQPGAATASTPASDQVLASDGSGNGDADYRLVDGPTRDTPSPEGTQRSAPESTGTPVASAADSGPIDDAGLVAENVPDQNPIKHVAESPKDSVSAASKPTVEADHVPVAEGGEQSTGMAGCEAEHRPVAQDDSTEDRAKDKTDGAGVSASDDHLAVGVAPAPFEPASIAAAAESRADGESAGEAPEPVLCQDVPGGEAQTAVNVTPATDNVPSQSPCEVTDTAAPEASVDAAAAASITETQDESNAADVPTAEDGETAGRGVAESPPVPGEQSQDQSPPADSSTSPVPEPIQPKPEESDGTPDGAKEANPSGLDNTNITTLEAHVDFEVVADMAPGQSAAAPKPEDAEPKKDPSEQQVGGLQEPAASTDNDGTDALSLPATAGDSKEEDQEASVEEPPAGGDDTSAVSSEAEQHEQESLPTVGDVDSATEQGESASSEPPEDAESQTGTGLKDNESTIPNNESTIPDDESPIPDDESPIPDDESPIPDDESPIPDSDEAKASVTVSSPSTKMDGAPEITSSDAVVGDLSPVADTTAVEEEAEGKGVPDDGVVSPSASESEDTATSETLTSLTVAAVSSTGAPQPIAAEDAPAATGATEAAEAAAVVVVATEAKDAVADPPADTEATKDAVHAAAQAPRDEHVGTDPTETSAATDATSEDTQGRITDGTSEDTRGRITDGTVTTTAAAVAPTEGDSAEVAVARKRPPPLDGTPVLASPPLLDDDDDDDTSSPSAVPASPQPPPLPLVSPPPLPLTPSPSVDELHSSVRVRFADADTDVDGAAEASGEPASPPEPPPQPTVQTKPKPKPAVKTKKAIRQSLLRRDSKSAEPFEDLDGVLDDIRRDNKTRLRKVSAEKPEAKAERREQELADGTDMTSALLKSLKNRRIRISDTLRLRRLSGGAGGDAEDDWGDGQ